MSKQKSYVKKERLSVRLPEFVIDILRELHEITGISEAQIASTILVGYFLESWIEV